MSGESGENTLTGKGFIRPYHQKKAGVRPVTTRQVSGEQGLVRVAGQSLWKVPNKC